MATAQELMEQNPKLSQAVDGLAEATLEEQVLAKLKEIEAILTKLDGDSIDLSVFLEQIQSFSDEKKAELQALVDKLDNPLGSKTITMKTFADDFILGNGGIFFQEVYMKDGVITKYGDVFFSGQTDGGFGTWGAKRQPLPHDVEFDYIGGCSNGYYARPKAGQSNKGGVSGSLDNVLFVWGRNTNGSLGVGNTSAVTIPKAITFDHRVKKISCGDFTGSAVNSNVGVLLENGDLMCAGYGQEGALATGNTSNLTTFQKVDSSVDDVFCPWTNIFIVKSNAIYACGRNTSGALGVGSTSSTATKTQVKTISSTDGISIKLTQDKDTFSFSLMLADGFLWGAGGNTHKNIVSSDTSAKTTFAKVTDSLGNEFPQDKVIGFGCSGYTTYILKDTDDGNCDLYIGGSGYLGDRDETASQVVAIKKVKTLNGKDWVMLTNSSYMDGSSDWFTACFIYNTKTLEAYALGRNINGGLGIGNTSTAPRVSEVLMPKANDINSVEIRHINRDGYSGVIAIIDGEYYACGSSSGGRIAKDTSTLQKLSKEL